MSLRTDEAYLRYDPFDGERDVDIKCHEVKIVTVRAERKCHGLSQENHGHPINKGDRARYEHALVDGEWGSYYVCLACMDKWLKDTGGLNEAQADAEAEGAEAVSRCVSLGTPCA